MRRVILFLGVTALAATLASTAEAQRGLGRGNTGQNVQHARERAQQARAAKAIAGSEQAMARAQRQQQFDAAVQAQQDIIKGLEDKAMAEMRDLTPAEKARIEAVKDRIARMKAQRETALARAEERAGQVRQDVQRERERNRMMKQGSCEAAGGETRLGPNGGTACRRPGF